MNNLRLCIFLILASLSLVGCSSFSVSGQASYPAENWMYLHPNPKAGDYSIIENEHFRYRYEVIEVRPSFIEVRFSLKDKNDSLMMKKLEDIQRFYHVKRNGRVIKSWVKSASSGEEVPSYVARPGDHFYIDNQQLIPITPAIEIITPYNKLHATQLHINNTTQGDMGISTDMKTVSYLSHDIPFGVIEKHWEISGGSITLVETIGKLVAKSSGLEAVHATILELRSMSDDPNKEKMVLTEFGKHR